MSAVKYWIWLSALDTLSVRAKAALIRRFGDAESVFFAPRDALAQCDGVSASESAVLSRRDLTRVDEILADCAEQHLSIITMQDALYPKRLKSIYAPPVVLYVRGHLPQIDDEAVIAVVGTRSASPYGLKMGRQIAYEIASCGGIVVSGLTHGIDAAAARGAMAADGICLGVLGTAHEQQDGELAMEVCRRGALISEYAPGRVSQLSFFRERKRISAGLSVGAVAVEAPEKSGTLLFAAEALEQGREVFAVPGNADAPGCRGTNSLLKDGATPATCGWDVMAEFAARFPDKIRRSAALCPEQTPPAPADAPPAGETARRADGKKEIDKEKSVEYIDLRTQLGLLSEAQLKIVSAIEKEPTHIDDIVEKTGLGAATVLTQLTVMTVKGLVRRVPGNRVVLDVKRRP